MTEALQNAAAQIDGIIAIDIPIKTKKNWELNILVSVASTAISLIPIVGPEAGLVVRTLFTIGRSALKNAPGLIVKNLPTNDPQAKRQFFTAELKNALLGVGNDSILPLVGDSLSSSLAIIQGVSDNSNASDAYTSFVNFTASGRLADSSQSLAQSGLVNSITAVQGRLQTYIVSEALSSDGWRILMLPGVNPVDVASDSSKYCPQWTGQDCRTKKGDIGCPGQLDQWGMCNYLWYSSNLNSSFTLMTGNDSAKADDVEKKLHSLFDNQYTNGVDLFEGATFCQFPFLFAPEASPLWLNYSPTSEWGYVFFGNASRTNDTLQRQSQNVTAETMTAYGGRDRFVPISPKNMTRYNAFVELSKYSSYNDRFKHPPDAVFQIDGRANVHLNCTSQLDVQVANTWGGKDISKWTLADGQNKPLVPPLQSL